MNRNRKIFFSLLTVIGAGLLLGGCTLPFLNNSTSLQVLSTPRATVMLNNKIIGETPFFNAKLKPGDYNLKLIPIGQADNVSPYQTQLKLKNGLKAAVNWNFGASLASSSGYLMTQETIADKKKAILMIISEPTGATVKLDGQNIGSTPLQKNDLTPKQYNLEINGPGYKTQQIVASVEGGYKLIIDAKLGQGGTALSGLNNNQASPSAMPSPTPNPNQKMIEISKTPTGWLRVRSKAGLSGEEVAKVKPGQKFAVLDKKNGWYQIEYQKNKKGWISGTYAKKVTTNLKQSNKASQPTPTSKPTSKPKATPTLSG